jgi:hypothetical protein
VQILTVDECAAWLATRHFAFSPAPHRGADHQVEAPSAFHTEWVGTPQDARTVASLGYRLSEAFPCTGALLVVRVVTSFQEHELDVFLEPRRRAGDTRWVDGVPGGATPGHLFNSGSPDDKRDAREMLGLLMAYTFEAMLVSDDGSLAVGIHDDVIEWCAREAAGMKVFEDITALLHLEQTSWGRELMRRRRTTERTR